MPPTTSVVIATKDNPSFVLDAVGSVLRGSHRPDQLIVVDQSAPLDDRVAVLARHPGVEVFNPPTVGKTLALNFAIPRATGDVIAFTDDDVIVDEGWLAELVAELGAGGERVVVTGRVVAAAEEGIAGGMALSLRTETEPAVHRGQMRRDPLSGNSMALFRSAFSEIGLFDERLGPGSRFRSGEDNDFGYRLLKAGYEIHYVPSALVHHRAWRAGRELARANWEYGRAQGAFLAKHALQRDCFARSRLRSAVTWRLRHVAGRPMRERKPGGNGDVRYLAAFVLGAAEWALTAKRSSSMNDGMAVSAWHDKRAADLMLAAPKTLPGDASVADVRRQFANAKVQMVLLADGMSLVGAITSLPDDANDDERAIRYIDPSPETISPGESGDVAFQRALASPHRRVIVVGRGGELLGLLCLNASRTGFCQSPS